VRLGMCGFRFGGSLPVISGVAGDAFLADNHVLIS
jgi:hypothetical protein